MKAQELLVQIRSTWIQRVAQSLTRAIGAREAFLDELNRFYDGLEQAVMTGNPAWLDTVLHEWTASPTLTDLQQNRQKVSQMLNSIIAITNDIVIENLSEQDALDLLSTITPIYTYGLEKVAHLETEARVAYITNELVEVRQTLGKLDRSKSNFISVAAHELKTPLTLIEGYAAMMRDLVAGNGNEEIDTLLAGVNKGISRLHEIIDDMLDVSLIDNDLLSLNLQPIWINQVLGSLGREMEATIQERRQTLEIKNFPGSETWIYADPERLYQAFRNVLSNAVKYTPDKGRITVDGRNLPGFIEIIIADTGIGISIEDQAMIFEKFGQVGRINLHSSSKTKFKGGGPGLGLPITRGIIEAHGGTIWVESPGCDEEKCPGSTFHILLPIRTERIDPKVTKLFSRLENQQTKTDVKANSSTNTTSP